MNRNVESLIGAEKWDEARAAIRAALEAEPSSHWLHARLALTYYEQYRYAEALDVAEQARRLAPRCPLVLWEVAGALSMLGSVSEAIGIYRRLTRRDLESVAFGDCGEGKAWARGLVADCFYRIGLCHRLANRRHLAERAIEEHLGRRGPGCRSIYPIAEVRRDLARLGRTS